MRVAVAFAITALLAASAAAEDWPAERAKLVAAAEAEGSLVVFALPNNVIRDFIVQEWNAAFPKVAISMIVLTHPQYLLRIRTERAAGRYLWDIAYAGPTSGYEVYRDGFLDELLPEMRDPEITDAKIWGGWDEAFIDNAGKYVFAPSAYLSGVSYDALHVKPEDARRLGLKVMLAPEATGKTVWHDPTVPGAGQVLVDFVRGRLGDDGFRTLLVDRKAQIVAQQNQVVEVMARGLGWFGIGPPVKMLMEPYAKAGVKADIRSFGNSPEVAAMTVGVGLYVFNRRPHPAASRLFVNWFLTKDMQTRMAKVREQNSRRRDVPSVAPADETPISGAKYDTPQRESYQERLASAVKLVRELRGEVK